MDTSQGHERRERCLASSTLDPRQIRFRDLRTQAQLFERPTLLITQGAKACAQSGKQLAKRFGCGIHCGWNSRIYAHSAIYFFDASTNVGKACPCARRERSGILRFAQNDTKNNSLRTTQDQGQTREPELSSSSVADISTEMLRRRLR